METNVFTALIAEQHSIARTIHYFTTLQIIVSSLVMFIVILSIGHLLVFGIDWPPCISNPLAAYRCHLFHSRRWCYMGRAYDQAEPGKFYWLKIRMECAACGRKFSIKSNVERFFDV
jgi:hypothetical protein